MKLLMILTLSCVGALATSSIPQLADQFHAAGLLNRMANDPTDCPANPTACTQAGCSYLEWPGCENQTTMFAMVKACRGNYNEQCLRTACGYLDWPGCRTDQTAFSVANACRGNLDGSCLKYVCGKLSWPGCKNLDTAIQAAASCGGG